MNVKILLCLSTIIVSFVATSQKPYSPYTTWLLSDAMKKSDCDKQPKAIKELCQTCALFTRAQTVYSMCCNNSEELQIWCKRAIEYGLQFKN